VVLDENLSVDQYCAETKISKGSFFQYFPSKTHLLEFAVLTFDGQLRELIEGVIDESPAGTIKSRLAYVYNNLVLSSRLEPEEARFYLFVTRASAHSAIAIEGVDLQRHLRRYVADILEEGVGARQVRRGLNRRVTADVIVALIGAIMSQRSTDPASVRRLNSDQFVALLLDGIGE